MRNGYRWALFTGLVGIFQAKFHLIVRVSEGSLEQPQYTSDEADDTNAVTDSEKLYDYGAKVNLLVPAKNVGHVTVFAKTGRSVLKCATDTIDFGICQVI